MTERVHDPSFPSQKALLSGVRGVQIVDFDRADECCGFGGTFSVMEEAVAAKMGYDKLAFMQKATPDCIVSSDMSCLMHLQGCARRQDQDIPFFHVAQILNGVSL
jgi:L-lactate dehydrogenase complex protein LldE